MSGYRPVVTPGCCALARANLEWFPAAPPDGAWHASSFRWDAHCDVPTSPSLTACPFCGAPLPARPDGPAEGLR